MAAIDQGIRLSDERTRLLMRRLENTYADAYRTAIANNEAAIAKYASLTDEALKDLTPEARQLKREAFKREIQRTKALSENIAAEISSAGKTAAQIIQGEMSGIYGLNYDFAAFDIQKQSGLNLSFAQYDRNQLAILVQEGQSPFTKIAYKNLGKDTVVVRRLQDQFIQGVMNGESQQKLIRRIKGVTGQSTRQAKRAAQTERNRVQSQGRNQTIHEAAEMGLGMKLQWIARLHNTRDLHMKTHLEIIKEGEKFSNGLEFPGDPSGEAENVINCFCLIKPMVESVSPALAKHREKFGQMSFAQSISGTNADINVAKTDIEYYKGQVSRTKFNRDIATSEGRFENAEYHKKELEKAQSHLSSAKRHLAQAEKNHAYAVDKWGNRKHEPFVRADTIEQAQKHALDKYGIKADYSGYSLEMANVLNQQVHDMRSVFGDNCFDGSLSVITTKNMNSAGQYGWNQTTGTGSIYMRPRDAKKGLDNLLEEAQYQYVNKNKFWSSGDAEHVIRHELGHSIERIITQKGIELSEVDRLMNQIKQSAFDKNENDYNKSVYSEYLSRYGMTKKSEFIAESIAEYMAGNARGTATTVSELIIKALKR